jgi:hypothetical protein
MTFPAPLRVPYPLLGQVDAEVEQSVLVARDVPHEDADLAIVNLAAVATPLAFHAHRVRAPFGEAAGIEGDNAIGFPQPFDHLSDQHLDQRPVIPGRSADEVLHDQALDINERRDVLGILAWQVGQESYEVEIHIALASLGLESVLIGYDEVAQMVHHVVEHMGRHDAVTQ